MASNIKVDIVRPTATNGSLSLKGDSGGSATTNGVTVNSSGNTAITGTTTVSSLVATTADINGGTIDGADITVGSGKTLDVSAGTLTLANDQISGNKIYGGSISNFASTGIDDNAASITLTIDNSGNVGIGPTSPNEKLEVNGVIRTNAPGPGSDLGTIAFGYETGTVNAEISAVRVGGNTTNNLIFSTASGGTLAERMRIDSSGNLKFDSGYGSVATAYACRAWVNFRGTTQSGTATASGLVSGQYTATVTSASQFTVVYSGTTYTINTSGNHEIGDGEGVDLTVSVMIVTIDTQIRASGNVSSITDNDVGHYTINFTNAMSDANYSQSVLVEPSLSNIAIAGGGTHRQGDKLTTSTEIATVTSSDSGYSDFLSVSVAIFR